MADQEHNLWRCGQCGYIHQGSKPPEHCPQCQADLNQFVLQTGLDSELEAAVKDIFAAEAKAHVRNLAFAKRAREEGYPQIEALFLAVAEAERVHADQMLRFMQGVVGDTEQNLRTAFENELMAKEEGYPPYMKLAHEAGRKDLFWALVRARDVEERHAGLYKRALGALLKEEPVSYHVCQVCGYVFEGDPPDTCPVCRAGKKSFKRMN